ncbi:MAG: glycosyltransferase [Lachnospiraceae bacterium]|nr:glycosyltransferase [Lachnospiraceae bacterium]
MEKISVVMPCYNDGKYIMEAIHSVEEQTYDNWEIIVVDDGSDEEDTIRILNSIKGEKITVLHSEHLRPAGARNYGIQQAAGKYILPLDSDDKIEKTYMEKAVKVLENSPDIGVVYCKADLFGEKSGIWDLPDYSFTAMLLDNIVFVTALFYRSDWEKAGGFSTNMYAGMEDYDFWLSILETGKTIYQIPEILFHYRIKPVSRTSGFQNDCRQVQDTYQKMYHNHINFYHQHFDEYACVLRDALIEQIFLRRKYEERLEKIQKIIRYPIIGKVIRNLVKE